jgi:hypothetical protein
LNKQKVAANRRTNNREVKIGAKSDLTADKRSKIERVMERDFQRGPQFKRTEIEAMMKDRNFAATYADQDRFYQPIKNRAAWNRRLQEMHIDTNNLVI